MMNIKAGLDTPLKHGENQLAAVIDCEEFQVFDQGIDIVRLCSEYAQALKEASCGYCIPCRMGSPILADLFRAIRDGEGSLADLEQIKSISTLMSEISMCEIGRSSPLVFLNLLEKYRDKFEAAITGRLEPPKSYVYKSIVTAPCTQACPIHLDIPRYVEKIKMGKFRESLNVIKERLPLPGVVGRVCVRPCESHCRRALVDEPIQIKHLKRFVADSVGTKNAVDYASQQEKNGTKIAIIGAGPAGVTCAEFLAQRGYDVTIFEMLPEPGGMAAVGIPDYRLPRSVLRNEVKMIEDRGVKINYGQALGVHFTLDDLEQQGFKGVFIGMGCHCHKPLDIEGEDKGYYGYVPGVYFLRNVNLGLMDEVPKGKKLVVVGGGNVAIDCVRIAFRLGFEESHIVYRRSKKEMPADPVEIEDAEAEGVVFHFLTAPKKIIGEDGKVTGLECYKMELGEPDASGRRRPVAVKDSEFVIDTDVIVAAIGQESDFSCTCNLPGVTTNKKGTLIVDENLMTSREGVFAGGDCITGPDVLIRACAHGRMAALKIDGFLRTGKMEALEEELDNTVLNGVRVFDPSKQVTLPKGTGRVTFGHEAPEERKTDFREVEYGFTIQEAVTEAGRCLRCYRLVMYAYEEA